MPSYAIMPMWLKNTICLNVLRSSLPKNQSFSILPPKQCLSTMGWNYFLTASFFETGAMAAPQKLQNPTDLGQAGPISTQWSHPSRFSNWCPLSINNGHSPWKRLYVIIKHIGLNTSSEIFSTHCTKGRKVLHYKRLLHLTTKLLYRPINQLIDSHGNLHFHMKNGITKECFRVKNYFNLALIQINRWI